MTWFVYMHALLADDKLETDLVFSFGTLKKCEGKNQQRRQEKILIEGRSLALSHRFTRR